MAASAPVVQSAPETTGVGLEAGDDVDVWMPWVLVTAGAEVWWRGDEPPLAAAVNTSSWPVRLSAETDGRLRSGEMAAKHEGMDAC